jgi:hypothetical protein
MAQSEPGLLELHHATPEEILLELWEFADAPEKLRGLVPRAHTGGWLAFIYPGGGEEVAQVLIDRWNSLGFSLARCQLEDGGIVLAGHHPPHSAHEGSVA